MANSCLKISTNKIGAKRFSNPNLRWFHTCTLEE